MKYLLYFHDGFIRKYALEKKVFTIGRAKECDLVIDENFISRRHAQVAVGEECVTVSDLGSKNGLFYKGGRVAEARVGLNESFCLKTIEFYLKQGDASEFQAAPELIPIFRQMGRRAEDRVRDIETRYIEDASLEVLKQLLAEGLKCRSLNDFLLGLTNYLSVFSDFGELLLACQDKDEPIYAYRHAGNEAALLAAARRAIKAPENPANLRTPPQPGQSPLLFLSPGIERGRRELALFPGTGLGPPHPKKSRRSCGRSPARSSWWPS